MAKAQTKADLQARVKELEAKVQELDKKLVASLEENVRIQTKFSKEHTDMIALEQLKTENKRIQNMYDLVKESLDREKKSHEKTKKQLKELKQEHEELKKINHEQKKSNKNNNDTIIDTLKSFQVKQNMYDDEIKLVQQQIEEVNEVLKKIDIKLELEQKNNDIVFKFFYNLEKMRKIITRNATGRKKKVPNGSVQYTSDDIRELMKTKTADELAKQFGFSRMTFFRKLKQAEQRENKLFY